jgi:hypothetical protein
MRAGRPKTDIFSKRLEKGGESGEAVVSGDEVFRGDTTFNGFNTFF